MSGTRNALIVGTVAYVDPKLRALRAPAEDAEELGGVLRGRRRRSRLISSAGG